MANKNPLYPGYHPGEKLPPRRNTGYRKRKPIPYRPGPFDELSEKFDDITGGVFNVPKWLLEQEKAAIELSLKANYYGGSYYGDAVVSPDMATVSTVSEEELEDVPGGSVVSGSLNPVDWVKDPKKQIKSFVWKPITSVLDYNDYHTKVRQNFWQEYFMSNDASPYSLHEGPGGSKEFYKDVRKAVPNFIGNSETMFFRNGAFNNYNKNLLSSLNEELNLSETKARLSDNSLRGTPGHFSNTLAFSRKVEVIDDFGDLEKNLKNVNKLYGEDFFKPLSINEGKRGDVVKELSKIDKQLDTIGRKLVSVDGSEGLQRQVQGMSKIVKDYAEYDSVGNLVGIKAGKEGALFRKLSIRKGNLHNNTVDGGVLGGFIRKVVDEDVRREGSVLQGIMSAKTASGDFIMSDAARNLVPLTRSIHSKWEWETAEDLASAFLDGKLPSQFIWVNHIKPKIDQFTPSFWLSRLIKKTHTFGLVAEGDVLEGNVKGLGGITKFFEGLMKDNTIGLDIDGVGLSFQGGKYLEDVFELKDQAGFTNAIDHLKLGGSLTGIGVNEDVVVKDGIEALKALSSNSEIRDEIKKLKLFDANGNFIDSDRSRKRLGLFLESFQRRSKGGTYPNSATPLVKKVGALERYSHFLQDNVQKPVFEFLDKIKVKEVLEKAILKREAMKIAFQKIVGKITEKVGMVIADALGVASGGITIAIAWVLKFVVKVVLGKIKKILKKMWSAIKKWDFTELNEEVEKSVSKTLKILLGIFGGCFFLIAVIVTVILSVIPSYDTGETCGTAVDGTKCVFAGDMDVGLGPLVNEEDYEFLGSSTSRCFEFMDVSGKSLLGNPLGSWDSGAKAVYENAVEALAKGKYLDNLCSGLSEGETIKAFWNPEESSGYCAEVSGTQIVFRNFPYCTRNQNYANYLLAHETGHVFSNLYPGILSTFTSSVYRSSEGPMPAYPRACGGDPGNREDFAEIIGHFIWKSQLDCGGWDYQGDYPKHFQFARSLFE